MQKPSTFPLIILVFLSLLGAVTLATSLRWGIGLTPDSVAYISAAREFLHGRGLRVPYGTNWDPWRPEPSPLVLFPPLYPTLLSIPGVFGVDPQVGAKWLNVALFGATIFMVGYVVNKYTGSAYAAALSSLLILTSSDIIQIHAQALSEPMFIFLGLLGLVLVERSVENPRLLWAASVIIGLAFLTRYPGAALIGTAVLGVLVLERKPIARRIADSVILAAIAVSPMLVWTARNLAVADTATSRQFAYHPITADYVLEAAYVVSAWALPERLPITLRGAVFVIIVASLVPLGLAFARAVRSPKTDGARRSLFGLGLLLTTFILTYLATLATSISFFQANTRLDYRLLSPVYVSLVILFVCAGQYLIHAAYRWRSLRVALILFSVALVGLSLQRAAKQFSTIANEGLGYASSNWRNSETIRKTRDLPASLKVYTNEPDGIYILTGRLSIAMPREIHPATFKPIPDYPLQLETVARELRKGDAILVYFRTRRASLTETALKDDLGLTIIQDARDGAIWGVRPGK